MAITPYLYYEDVRAALNFLSKGFGFRRLGRAMSGPNGKLIHAAMKFGEDVIMMGCPPAPYKNPKRLGQATQCLYINVTDVDKHFKRAKKMGAKILEEPKVTPYGDRRYGAEDQEGHQWYFAQTLKTQQQKRTSAKRARK